MQPLMPILHRLKGLSKRQCALTFLLRVQGEILSGLFRKIDMSND